MAMRLDRARLNLWSQIGDLVAHEINLTGNQIIQRRACALVGNFVDFRQPELRLQQRAAGE